MLPIHPIPAFSDNYFWLLHRQGKAWVVDPGDASPVINALEEFELELEGILITHHHFDHTGGVAELRSRYQVPAWGPVSDQIPDLSRTLEAGTGIEVLERQFVVMATPGHTLDHIAYYAAPTADQPPVLLCGDTLFAGGCGRLFEGSPEQMLHSLESLAALPPQTLIYCAHEYTLANLRFAAAVEPANDELQRRIGREQERRKANQPTLPSTMAAELATNPFLRSHIETVHRAAEAQAGRSLNEGEEVFATIRAWKDDF